MLGCNISVGHPATKRLSGSGRKIFEDVKLLGNCQVKSYKV
jgi:hypothetical protein